MIGRLKTLILASIAVLILTAACLRNTGSVNSEKATLTTTADTSSELSGTGQPPVTSNDGMIESRLKGRWQRNDGSYYLQIYSVSPDSTLKAGYFNPNPVNVESGEWIIREGKIFMRIILRDVNYPGSTYIIEYQPEEDILAGNYFQAVDGINYEVFFSRVK